MDCVQDLRMRNVIAGPRVAGIGISARKMAEGRCVSAIVLTLPILLLMEAATRVLAEAMREVVKKREPSCPSGRENFRWKNAVTQDLY